MKKLLTFSFGLALVAGCSGDATGPKRVEADSLKDRAGFCSAWADAACNEDVVDACGAKDENDCMAAQKDYCASLVPAGYKSANAETCIAAVKRAYDDAELNRAELDLVLNLAGECGRLVQGSSAEGVTCTVSTQCNTVKGYTCVIKPGKAEGTCQVAVLQSAGQSCDKPEEVCQTGYYCAEKLKGGGICGAQGTSADDEDGPDLCDDDSMCIAADLCDLATGTCAPKLQKPAECTADAQCASGICLTTAANPKCVDAVVLTPEASICTTLGG